MLSYLMFNRFQMSTPAYREAKNRLSDMDWNTSPQNLLNWADKGAMQLKKIALQDDAFSPTANPEESRSELMSKALNYLKMLWNQIFAYRNDDEYSIDNLPAERALRPVTFQRKNSLFFGSVKGIQNSAIYNTFIETCKQAGVYFRDYFCKLLRELKKGRTDYVNLLHMTICKQ